MGNERVALRSDMGADCVIRVKRKPTTARGDDEIGKACNECYASSFILLALTLLESSQDFGGEKSASEE